MLNILARSGTLVSDPVERRSVTGKPYATCTMRTPAEDSDAVLISVIAFNAAAVAARLALRRGDSVAVAGRGKLTSREKDGEEKHGLSVVADRVLSAYAAGKVRKAAREAEEAELDGQVQIAGGTSRPVSRSPSRCGPQACRWRDRETANFDSRVQLAGDRETADLSQTLRAIEDSLVPAAGVA